MIYLSTLYNLHYNVNSNSFYKIKQREGNQLDALLTEISKQMVVSLRDYAEEKGIPLEEVKKCFKNLDTTGLNSLDDLFQDNGEGRLTFSVHMNVAGSLLSKLLSLSP